MSAKFDELMAHAGVALMNAAAENVLAETLVTYEDERQQSESDVYAKQHNIRHRVVGEIDENAAIAFTSFFTRAMMFVAGRKVFWRVLPVHNAEKDFESDVTLHKFRARFSTMDPDK